MSSLEVIGLEDRFVTVSLRRIPKLYRLEEPEMYYVQLLNSAWGCLGPRRSRPLGLFPPYAGKIRVCSAHAAGGVTGENEPCPVRELCTWIAGDREELEDFPGPGEGIPGGRNVFGYAMAEGSLLTDS